MNWQTVTVYHETGTTTTSNMRCADCGVVTNPAHWVDGRLLCRRCANLHVEPLTVPCPFCNATGRVRA